MSNSAFTPNVLTTPASSTSGTGQGEINAFTNSTFSTDEAGWTAGTSHTRLRVTSSSPLDPIVTTALQITSSAAVALGSQVATSGVYGSIASLPSSLRNRKLKVEFYASVPATGGSWALAVYAGATKLSLTTDSSGDTILPAGFSGKFTAYFDATDAQAYSVNFVQRARTGANTLIVTQVVVGPGIQPQGAVVGEWQSYTPTGGWSGANIAYSGKYRRVGDSMELKLNIAATGAPTGTNLTAVSLPSGHTIDTSKLPTSTASSGATIFGYGSLYDASPGDTYPVYALYNNTTSVNISYSDDAATGVKNTIVSATGPVTIASGDTVFVQYTVPIAEWAGSGTVQLAQNDVEFAWNDDPETTAGVTYNNSSFYGYGPNGASTKAINSTTLASTTNYRVQFQTPIQATDKIDLEIFTDSGWVTANSVSPFINGTSNSFYGAVVTQSGTNTADVSFGNNGSRPTSGLGSNGVAWPGGFGTRWRVRKSSAGAAVGFGIVQPGVSSGLVSASGLPGNTTGSAVAAGYVGEKLDFTSRSVTGGDQAWVANANALVTLTPGTWLILGNAAFSIIGTAQAVAISTSTTAGSGQIAKMTVVQNATLNVEGQLPVAYYQVTSGTTQSLYIHGVGSSATTGTMTVNGFAIRIA